MNHCEECGKAEATLQVTEVARGRVSRLHLCEACAVKRGFVQQSQQEGVEDLISHVSRPGARQRIRITTPQEACPTCGLHWHDFEMLGLLGCEDCYKTFAMQLTRMLREAHQVPLQSAAGKRRASDPSALLPELRSLLEQAIREEDYESAAQLRDRIHQLERSIPAAPDAEASADDEAEET